MLYAMSIVWNGKLMKKNIVNYFAWSGNKPPAAAAAAAD
jgi:hypothetical protein